MGLCQQLYDNMPNESFMKDSGYYHCKYKLTPMENERLEFAVVDVSKIEEEF
jgi:hypothetical protein